MSMHGGLSTALKCVNHLNHDAFKSGLKNHYFWKYFKQLVVFFSFFFLYLLLMHAYVSVLFVCAVYV